VRSDSPFTKRSGDMVADAMEGTVDRGRTHAVWARLSADSDKTKLMTYNVRTLQVKGSGARIAF